MARQIVISPATRIEGHARILLDLDDAGAVSGAHLEVLDIRGFEKLLERMELLKMPLSAQGHHALMDGIHLARFYARAQEYLDHPGSVLGNA